MQNDILTALLLDPFITLAEAEKEFGAISTVRQPKPETLEPAPSNGRTQTSHLPARTRVPGMPVIHHPPVTAG